MIGSRTNDGCTLDLNGPTECTTERTSYVDHEGRTSIKSEWSMNQIRKPNGRTDARWASGGQTGVAVGLYASS
jgi:hypothetical protein